ncbi:MAG TPA: hypothetical protein PLS50_03850 [Candidatus Dojkabacteria bacterium]|nr:hypothetical protein [Candidatus Dojkabacteria bacterium]
MDESVNNIIELRFSGSDINPSKVKPSEIASLLANFERSLLAQIKLVDPTIDTDVTLFSFDAIHGQSIDLLFKPLLQITTVLASYTTIATSFINQDYQNISSRSIEPLKEIIKFSKKYNCVGYFYLNNTEISSFEPNQEIKTIPNSVLEGETTIYGKIIRIGGEDPKIHFRINEEEKLIFDIDESLAKKLSPKLYEFIGLVGVAKWNSENFSIENFKLLEIIDIDKRPIIDSFNELQGLIGKHWDEVEDIDSYLN